MLLSQKNLNYENQYTASPAAIKPAGFQRISGFESEKIPIQHNHSQERRIVSWWNVQPKQETMGRPPISS